MSSMNIEGVLEAVGDVIRVVQDETAEKIDALRSEVSVAAAARVSEARGVIEADVRASIGKALVSDRSAELDRTRSTLKLSERRARYEQVSKTVSGIVAEAGVLAARRLKKASAVVSVDGRKLPVGTFAEYDLESRRFKGATAAQLLDPMFAGSLEPLRKLVQRAVDRLPESFLDDRTILQDALTKLTVESDHHLLKSVGVEGSAIGDLRAKKAAIVDDLKTALDELNAVEAALRDVRTWARAFSIGLRERRSPPIPTSLLAHKSDVVLGFEDTDPVATARYLSKAFLDRMFGITE